jgi:hypothetical protein
MSCCNVMAGRKELSLQLRNKTPKRREKAKRRKDQTKSQQINDTWAAQRATARRHCKGQGCRRLQGPSGID